MKRDYIPFNIWDDYYDDGYVPEGEIQETYGYVESDEFSEREKAEIAVMIVNYIKTHIDLPGVIIEARGDVEFKHLTHELRSKLVKELKSSSLTYEGVTFRFYSES